jgi:hypothetical protein
MAMSRKAVSCEHLASLAYFEVVSFPSRSVEKTVKHKAVALIERDARDRLPESCFRKNCPQGASRAIDRSAETVQEPCKPSRDIHVSGLSLFENVEVGRSFMPDLTRHAVEALRALFRSRQLHVRNCTSDAAVAVLERMYGYEPEMSDSGFQNRVDFNL